MQSPLMGWAHTVCTKRWAHCVSGNYYWWNGIKSDWKAFWSGSKCNSIFNSGCILPRDCVSQMMTMWRCCSYCDGGACAGCGCVCEFCRLFSTFGTEKNGFEFKLEYVLMVDMICVVFKWLRSHIEFRTGRCRRHCCHIYIYILKIVYQKQHMLCAKWMIIF